jgi:hypothetical protein
MSIFSDKTILEEGKGHYLILFVVLTLFLIAFPHEFGHWLVAKAFGIEASISQDFHFTKIDTTTYANVSVQQLKLIFILILLGGILFPIILAFPFLLTKKIGLLCFLLLIIISFIAGYDDICKIIQTLSL